MIIRPATFVQRSRNQPSRECLYAWYPDVATNASSIVTLEIRDIYIHKGIDQNLLEQKSSKDESKNSFTRSNTVAELVDDSKQSIVSNALHYHSSQTVNEALSPPWALHYEVKRPPATPNLSSNSADMSIQQETSRRLKSAPVTRSLPPTAALIIPEPRFLDVIIPVTTTNNLIPPSTRTKTRASSAKARLSSSSTSESQQKQRREIKSAHASRSKTDSKLTDEEIQQILKQVYGEENDQPTAPKEQPVRVVYKQVSSPQISPSPIYIYQKSSTWSPNDEVSSITDNNSVVASSVSLNPHHIYRPSIIAVKNNDKQAILRENSALKNPSRHHRRHHSTRRNEPLVAVTPISEKPKLSLEIGGVKLTYDPKLTLQDKSTNLNKYFIDGKLYLIKDQRYNVLDNIDQATLEKYNKTLKISSQKKPYQTIPIEKFQIPQPLQNVFNDPTERNFRNSSTSHAHRYMIDSNLISDHLNVNKMSLSKRTPATTIVYA